MEKQIKKCIVDYAKEASNVNFSFKCIKNQRKTSKLANYINFEKLLQLKASWTQHYFLRLRNLNIEKFHANFDDATIYTHKLLLPIKTKPHIIVTRSRKPNLSFPSNLSQRHRKHDKNSEMFPQTNIKN